MEAKNDAQKIAVAWKSKLNLHVVISPGEANVFSQFLLYYGISKEFHDDDILCVLLVHIFHLPEAPELCRALQISHKMPDDVEKMSSSGKQIEAIQFIYEFGLVEKFTPVPLLKAYLKDEKKVSEELAKKGTEFVCSQNTGDSR